jgi:competence protein ComEC
MRYGGFSMMMMGDAGKKAEQCMMSDWNGKLNTSILKAGHHGSKYSSSEEFLEYISPAAALISCGIDNRYKHPHKEMLQRIEALGAASYRTDEGGAVIVKVDSMNMQIKSYCVSR